MHAVLPSLLSILLGFATTATSQTIEPIFEESTLNAGGRGLTPTRVYQETFREIEAGEYRLRLGRSFVARVDAAGEELWRVPLSGDHRPRYVGAHDRIALFAVMEIGQSNQRLDLETGNWLSPLELESPPEAVRTTTEVIAEPLHLLSEIRGCYVLVGWRREGEDADLRVLFDSVFDCYSIVCLDQDMEHARWVHHEPSRGRRPNVSGPFWRWRDGELIVPPTHSLARAGFGLVACAGERGDILCLEASSGQLIWRIERLWEFDRGYVGPSCFNYFVSRFGYYFARSELAGMDIESEWLPRTAILREEFENAYSCAIAAGPVVVPKQEDRTRAGEALLVVVERGPATYLCKALSEARVYEIDSRGQPIAVAPLPRRLLDDTPRLGRRGVIWSGPRGAFVHCSASDNDGVVGMGPELDTKQCVAQLDWYRELSWNPEDPWLRCPPARDVIAYGDGCAFRPAAGMYVNSEEEKLIHFPIWRLHLEGQCAELLDLRIPIRSRIPAPGTNYECVGGRYRTFSPHALSLVALDVAGDSLRVTIGPEDRGRRPEADESLRLLEFDLADLDD